MGTRFSVRLDRPWGPSSLLYNGYRIFPGGKVRPGRAADHSLPSSATVMEQYSYTSTHRLGHTEITLLFFTVCPWGRDSSVGIVTCYGLDGPGIESRLWSEIFRTRPDRSWGPLSLLYNGYRVFRGGGGVKQPGRGVDQPPPSSAEVKERVELYLYSRSGPLWPVRGWTLPIPLPLPRICRYAVAHCNVYCRRWLGPPALACLLQFIFQQSAYEIRNILRHDTRKSASWWRLLS